MAGQLQGRKIAEPAMGRKHFGGEFSTVFSRHDSFQVFNDIRGGASVILKFFCAVLYLHASFCVMSGRHWSYATTPRLSIRKAKS
jgi:hypothetical protein